MRDLSIDVEGPVLAGTCLMAITRTGSEALVEFIGCYPQVCPPLVSNLGVRAEWPPLADAGPPRPAQIDPERSIDVGSGQLPGLPSWFRDKCEFLMSVKSRWLLKLHSCFILSSRQQHNFIAASRPTRC